MKTRNFTKDLRKIFKDIVPNGEALDDRTLLELIRFRNIVESFLKNQGRSEMEEAYKVKEELTTLIYDIDSYLTLNSLCNEFDIIKNGHTNNPQFTNKSPLVQERLIKLMKKGINLGDIGNLNEETKDLIYEWAKFLNEHKINIKVCGIGVCGIDNICYIMKNFLHMKYNMKRTKKQIDIFNDIKKRSNE